MMMTARRKIEMTIRAAKLAHDALEMLGTQSIEMAKLHFVQIARSVKDLEDFLKAAAND